MKLETAKKLLKGFGRIENMYSPSRSGGKVANQFEIHFDNGRVFQSYDSIIAIKLNGKMYLTNDWDYSVTTGKYRNQFLNETKKETEVKIKAGIYKIIE